MCREDSELKICLNCFNKLESKDEILYYDYPSLSTILNENIYSLKSSSTELEDELKITSEANQLLKKQIEKKKSEVCSLNDIDNSLYKILADSEIMSNNFILSYKDGANINSENSNQTSDLISNFVGISTDNNLVKNYKLSLFDFDTNNLSINSFLFMFYFINIYIILFFCVCYFIFFFIFILI
jgi:hypothetical protein